MTRNSLYIFSTIIIDGLAGLSGGLLSDRWLTRRRAGLTGFAAGAILSAVFMNILPESVQLGETALTRLPGGHRCGCGCIGLAYLK